MLNHEDVWRAIDALASRKGLSPSALARTAGLDPTTFNKSKRYAPDGRPRWPSTESIAKVLRATRTSITELFGDNSGAVEPGYETTVPLLGSAHAGEEDTTTSASPTPARIINFPDRQFEPMYALNVVGDSMLPLYRNGDILFVSSAPSPSVGDRIVVRLTNGETFVKVLKSISGSSYELLAVNPNHETIVVDASDIDLIAKIVYASQ